MNELIAFINIIIVDKDNTYLTKLVGDRVVNGYIAIPEDHPYYGMSHNELILDIPLTYSSTGKEAIKCLKNIKFIDDPCDLKDYWVLGFETGNYTDDSKIRSEEAVVKELLHLREQLEEVYE